MNILTEDTFGGEKIPSGLITLRNKNGLIAQFSRYGARWISMWVPDRQGKLEDVVLGFDTLSGYCLAGEKYHGAIVGRVCGRIDNARFFVGEDEYKLAQNDAYGKPEPNHLHGGVIAFHNRDWEGESSVTDKGEQSAVFTLYSEDGEEGYPGNLQVKVTYTLRDDNVLSMRCEATCDKPTPVNLTNHAFFNLSGNDRDILAHTLSLGSSRIIECDDQLIPTGDFVSVDRTLLDFREPRPIGDALRSEQFHIKENKGFSLAFALDQREGDLRKSAELFDAVSGRNLAIYTNQPSMQVYTGYFMDGKDRGKNNVPYFQDAGIALEAQGYPDAMNHPAFPSILLAPGEIYNHDTEYHFSVIPC